jgi:CubicO group peptidase (beta-lactamase class C family)
MKNKLIASLLFLLALPSFAQTTDQLKKIDQLFSAWNNATPGVAVAVQQGDNIIYNKAFGLADLEHTVPNTTETILKAAPLPNSLRP